MGNARIRKRIASCVRIGALCIALMVFCQVSAFASWAWVQDASSGADASDTTIALAYGSNITAGSLLLAAVAWDCTGAQTISGVADSQTQTWTQIGTSITLEGSFCFAAFRFWNSTAGANTVTATFSAGAQYRGIVITEYSGLATAADPLDQSRTDAAQTDPGTGTDAVTSGATGATSDANELVWGAMIVKGGINTDAAGTGFTIRENASVNLFLVMATEEKNLVSPGATAATFTAGVGTSDHATIVATFKEPAAGGGATPKGTSISLTGAGR